MLTTKTVGIGAETSDPKPVRQFNWCGQPMKEGDSYWGESKPKELEAAQDIAQPRPSRSRGTKRNSAWTAERRAEYGAKMKAWWQAKREKSTSTGGT